VLVILTQNPSAMGGDIGALHAIGWYALNASGKVEAKGPFQSNMEVHAQFNINPAAAPYTIVPCTFSPGLEGSFTIAVYSPPHAQVQFALIPRT
jgi:hypothetical protein